MAFKIDFQEESAFGAAYALHSLLFILKKIKQFTLEL